MATEKDWDYRRDGEVRFQESMWMRRVAHVVDHPGEELLIPARTFLYHDVGHGEVIRLPVGLVDYYRCWPPADPQDPTVQAFVGSEIVPTPVVIYCDGRSAVLGDGQHRLAAAKVLGLDKIAVTVVPDRLELEPGVVAVEADPEVAASLERVTRKHHGTASDTKSRHQLSRHTVWDTVYVFCACGAHWRRPAH